MEILNKKPNWLLKGINELEIENKLCTYLNMSKISAIQDITNRYLIQIQLEWARNLSERYWTIKTLNWKKKVGIRSALIADNHIAFIVCKAVNERWWQRILVSLEILANHSYLQYLPTLGFYYLNYNHVPYIKIYKLRKATVDKDC